MEEEGWARAEMPKDHGAEGVCEVMWWRRKAGKGWCSTLSVDIDGFSILRTSVTPGIPRER